MAKKKSNSRWPLGINSGPAIIAAVWNPAHGWKRFRILDNNPVDPGNLPDCAVA